MNLERVLRELQSLPEAQQAEVNDFIAFLKQRHPVRPRPTRKAEVTAATFLGMWADREDLADSSAWVRDLRTREWARRA